MKGNPAMSGGPSTSKPAWLDTYGCSITPAFCFARLAALNWSESMDQDKVDIGQEIARAARAFEKRRTNHGRKWSAVFLNEDTIVIVLYGSLTAAEKALAQSPAGAAQIQEFHRQLFANVPAAMHRKIKSITGMEVRNTTAEIDPMTGSVRQIFTTDTVWENFLIARDGPPARLHTPPSRRESGAHREADRTGCVIRVDSPSLTERISR
jgi:uncharacterized protein YbcI